MSETMFELSATLQNLLAFADGDTDEDEQAYIDTLEGIKGEIGLKADSYKYVIDQLKARAEMCRKAADELKAKADRIDANVSRMNHVILSVVEQVPPDAKGKRKIEGKAYTFSSAKNGGKLPIEYTAEVPQDYKKAEIKWMNDTDKIRADLDTGKALPFAHYGERGTHLQIK